jgi:hypothetical protein
MPVLSPVQDIENSQASDLSARGLYFDLIHGQPDTETLERSRQFLTEQLWASQALDTDAPQEIGDLEAWMLDSVEQVGHAYQEYLEARQAGGERRYFLSKSHALSFLRCVAPTKLVDGAWLYGLLPHWQDPRFTNLIRTYLEELGDGVPSKNHVVLYRKLLASQGCDNWQDLGDEYFAQGAIQLALAYGAEHFLPEIIGFNLGYEQLPLHLLITAYELRELGIDPYYFTLHITVDNADSGHARQAVNAVFDAMPRAGDAQDFWRRVRNGYNLNFLGESSNSVIESFDIDREMKAIFARKATIGQYAHSDYRRVAGKTVNEWLSCPAQTDAFTAAMEAEGWFKRHQDPQNSRFWRLIQSEKARMFGVFSAYEQQVIFDWIAGDAPDKESFARPKSLLSFEARQRLRHRAPDAEEEGDNDFAAEVRALETSLALAETRRQLMDTLISLMSPSSHHSAAGLKATRIFHDILG